MQHDGKALPNTRWWPSRLAVQELGNEMHCWMNHGLYLWMNRSLWLGYWKEQGSDGFCWMNQSLGEMAKEAEMYFLNESVCIVVYSLTTVCIWGIIIDSLTTVCMWGNTICLTSNNQFIFELGCRYSFIHSFIHSYVRNHNLSSWVCHSLLIGRKGRKCFYVKQITVCIVKWVHFEIRIYIVKCI